LKSLLCKNDPELQQKLADKPQQYARIAMSHDVNVICYIPEPGTPWKICLPTAMLHNTVRWYHLSLNHIGMTRTYDTMSMHLYHPKLKKVCEDVIRPCDSCQRFKLPGKGYGEMPARNPQVAPWHEVAVDLIGPWKITVNGQRLVFRALTIIDTVTMFLHNSDFKN
jgi:hypothetical protein